MLDMVHHPWVELYRMRRSMRQIPLAAGAPTAASSTFTNTQVAAATAAAGAAIGAANVSASCPSLANLSALLQSPPPAALSNLGESREAAPAGEQQPMSAAAAAAAALNAVKKNIKQTVAQKMIAGAHALQGKAEPMLVSKEELHAALSSASSPCLLAGAGKPRGPSPLLKAAMAAPASAPAPVVASAASPAALAPPPPLHKGGSLKLDADARTFLFANAFGSSAPSSGKAPAAGALAAAGPLTASAPKQQAAVLAAAGKLPANTFRAAH